MKDKKVFLFGAGLKPLLENQELQEELNSLSLIPRAYPLDALFESIPDCDVLVIDFSPPPPDPHPEWLNALVKTARASRMEILAFNSQAVSLPKWEKLFKLAQVITSPSFQDASAFFDRFLRCLELPAEPSEKKQYLHSRLLMSSIQRQFRVRPEVSVVIPVFNTPVDYLREAVQSVLAQEDPGLELVLVENGDQEITGPVIKQFSDPRLRYYQNPGPRGIATGRNLGNMLARGKLIAVMDHDDMAAPQRLRLIKEKLKDRHTILYSDLEELFPDGTRRRKKLKRFSAEELRRDCNIYHPSVAYSWELAREIPYDPRFEPADDYRFYLEALRRGKKLVHVPEPLLIYRRHSAQHSQKAAKRLIAAARAARHDDRYLREGGDPQDRKARFEFYLLQMIAAGEEDTARAMLEAGYGSERIAAAMKRAGIESGVEVPPPAPSENASRAKAGWNWPWETEALSAWLALERRGEQAALEAWGEPREDEDPRSLSDRADLVLRTEGVGSAEEILRAALSRRPRPALSFFLQEVIRMLRERELSRVPEPPALSLTREAGKGLTILLAGEEEEARRIRDSLQGKVAGRPVEVIGVPGSSARSWNQGLSRAGGGCFMFLNSREAPEPSFLVRAVSLLEEQPGLDAVLGRVFLEKGGVFPERPAGLAAVLRAERALLSGLVVKREAVERAGGFIEELGRAAAWEFMIRVFKKLHLLQREEIAAVRCAGPFVDEASQKGPEAFREALGLSLLIKFLHRPLRYLDWFLSGEDPAFLESRFRALERVARRYPALVRLLDPWEFMAGFNEPYHLLYRLSQRLREAGLLPEARAAAGAALILAPGEPKVWFNRAMFFLKGRAGE